MLDASTKIVTTVIKSGTRSEAPFFNCGMERENIPFQFDIQSKSVPLENLLKGKYYFVQCYPQENRHLFWRDRLIICMTTAENIFSVGFLPKRLEGENIFVIKKRDEEMPAMEDKERLEEWMTLPNPVRRDEIRDIPSMLATIKDLYHSDVYVDIQACLECFVRDGMNQALRITFAPSEGEQITREWVKK